MSIPFLNGISIDGMTAGSVVIVGAGGALTQDNASLFYDATNDFLGVGIATPLQRLHVAYGNIRFEHLTNPGACVAALAGAGAGNVDNGTHAYRITFVTATGESGGGTPITVTVADKTVNGKVSLSSIATGLSGVVTSRNIYRTKAGGGPFYLLANIADNTTTTYTDNTADSSLGATLCPTSNFSAGHLMGTANDLLVVASGGSLIGPNQDKGGAIFNVRAYGAVGDSKYRVGTGSISAGGTTLTVSDGNFTASDVGKPISVAWAGSGQVANPTTQATVAVTGGGSTGGLLAAGTYYVAYSWTTAHGETTRGTSESAQFTVAAGNIPRVTIPSLPAGAAAANIHLTAAGGASGSSTLYATGVTGTTYDLSMPSQTRYFPTSSYPAPTVNKTAGPLGTVIAGVTSSTVVTLADAATVACTASDVLYGTDCTGAFQAALNAAVGGGIVMVPTGNYLVSQIFLKTNHRLRGSGWSSIIYQRGGTSGPLVSMATTSELHCVVENITLDGTKAVQSTANDIIYFDNATTGDKSHVISDCLLNLAKGNGITIGQDTREVTIKDVYVAYPDQYGISIDSTDVLVVGCRVANAGRHGLITLSNSGACRFFALHVYYSGRLDSGNGNGFHVGAPGHVFNECYSQDNTGHGYYFPSSGTRAAMDGCVAACNGGDGWRLDGPYSVTCNGCYVGNVGGTPQTHNSVLNLTSGTTANVLRITFDEAAVSPGHAYVQGTPAGNDIHLGPDGGFQTPAFPGTSTVSSVNTGTDVVTTTAAHGLSVGDPVFLTTSNTLPGGLALQTAYWVRTVPSTTTFTLAPTSALAATVDITSAGTGTHTVQKPLLPTPYDGNYHKLTMTADMGISNPVYQHQGQKLSFQLAQDATGGRKVAWGSAYTVRKWIMNTNPSKVNTIDFIYDGSAWVQLGGTNDDFGAAGTLDRTATSQTSNNLGTGVDTTLYTVNVPGDLLGATGCLRVTVIGDILCNSGAPTWTFKIKFGATTLWADATAAFGAATTRVPYFLEFFIANANATNAQVLGGTLTIGAVAAATTGEGDLATVAKSATPVYGTASIDTTATASLTVTVTPSVQNAAVEITRKWAMTELVN